MRDARRWLTGGLLIAWAVAAAAPVAGQDKPSAKADEAQTDAAKSEETKAADSAKSDTEFYEQMQSFVDLLDQVERNYVEGIDRKQLLQAAIDGVLEKLDP